MNIVLSIEVSPDHKYILSSSADAIIGKYSIPVDISEDPRMKLMDTKHSGQQSIKIRDDGKIFATGGWDKMVRVYSMKTMKELAVLKWHREGVYAVGFGMTRSINQGVPSNTVFEQSKSVNAALVHSTEPILGTVPTSQYLTLEERRDEREVSRHWIAAGAKDGKVSLWEVY
jgi:ASTRA-associated protein 1